MSDILSPGAGETAPRWAASPNVRDYTLVGVAFGLAFPIIATTFLVAQQQLPWSLESFMAVQGANPLLWMIDSAPLFLGTLAAMAGLRQDTLADRNLELIDRERELTGLKNGLEDHVAGRTHELEARNAQLRSAVQLTRRLADIRDADLLLQAAATFLAEGPGTPEADIYLLDPAGDRAVLRASSSDSGKLRIARGDFVNAGDESVVGQVAARGKAYVSPVPSIHAEGLRDSSSSVPIATETAIPLVSRGRILGVLHLKYPAELAGAGIDPEILRLVADQLAASLDNIRLLSETRVSLEHLGETSAAQTRLSWRAFVQQRALTYQYTPRGVRIVPPAAAVQDPATLRVPINLRGGKIGTIAVRRQGRDRWPAPETDLAQKVADQVALALENSRLLEESRERADFEQKISSMSDKLGKSVDLDALLQTAVRELAALPEVSDASVFLRPAADAGEAGDS